MLPNPGWSVVYGEVPAASKWSQLGANDDALSNGSGLIDNALITRHYTNGSVTDPKWRNGVAFRATTSQSITAQQNVTSFTEEFDLGSNFNPATGVFTAPHNGIYQLNVNLAIIDVSGRIHSRIFAGGALVAFGFGVGTATTHDPAANAVVTVTMNAGQTANIDCYVESGTKTLSSGSSFSGFMVTRI